MASRFSIITTQSVDYIDKKTQGRIKNVISIEGCQYRLNSNTIQEKSGCGEGLELYHDVQNMIKQYNRTESELCGFGMPSKANFAFEFDYRYMSTKVTKFLKSIIKKIDNYTKKHTRFQGRESPGYFDILPSNVDKGKALKLLIKKSGVTSPLSLAAGDGSSDEFAFVVADIGIGVNRKNGTNANVRVKTVIDVYQILQYINGLYKAKSAASSKGASSSRRSKGASSSR